MIKKYKNRKFTFEFKLPVHKVHLNAYSKQRYTKLIIFLCRKKN